MMVIYIILLFCLGLLSMGVLIVLFPFISMIVVGQIIYLVLSEVFSDFKSAIIRTVHKS